MGPSLSYIHLVGCDPSPSSPYLGNKHFYRVLAVKGEEQIAHKSTHKNVKLSEVPSAINRVRQADEGEIGDKKLHFREIMSSLPFAKCCSGITAES